MGCKLDEIYRSVAGASRSTDKLIVLMTGISEAIDRVESVEEVSLIWDESKSGELLPKVVIKGLKLKQ